MRIACVVHCQKKRGKKISNFTEIRERQSPAGATFKFSLVTCTLSLDLYGECPVYTYCPRALLTHV